MANGNGTPDPTTNCGVGIDNRRRIMALEKSQESTWTALDQLRAHLDESMDKLRNRAADFRSDRDRDPPRPFNDNDQDQEIE